MPYDKVGKRLSGYLAQTPEQQVSRILTTAPSPAGHHTVRGGRRRGAQLSLPPWTANLVSHLTIA